MHAGLVPGVMLEAQDPAGMITMRNLVKGGLGRLSYTWSDKVSSCGWLGLGLRLG